MSWRGLIEEFRDRLPVSDATPVVTLLEGNTPLIRLNHLSDRTGCEILGKAEKPMMAKEIAARLREVLQSGAQGQDLELVDVTVVNAQTVGSFDVVTAAYLFVYAKTHEELRTMCAVAVSPPWTSASPTRSSAVSSASDRVPTLFGQ